MLIHTYKNVNDEKFITETIVVGNVGGQQSSGEPSSGESRKIVDEIIARLRNINVVFVIDGYKDKVALQEAKMIGIEVLGIADSNADPDLYKDDSADNLQELIRNQLELSNEVELADKEWMDKVTQLESLS